jgi:hypothetical protein
MTKYTHAFWTTYGQTDKAGVSRDYATLHTFDSLNDARNAHTNARPGLWMTADQHDGHVSALHTYQSHARLPEAHLPAHDIN